MSRTNSGAETSEVEMGIGAAMLVAEQMEECAREWLSSLDSGQIATARFAAPNESTESEQERLRWYYTPTDHGGLPLGSQNPHQQQLAMKLISTGLSEAGYVTVSSIIGLENVLDQVEGWKVGWGRDRGRDPGLFYLRIFGTPGDSVWAWRLGGHHVSLNNLVVDGRLASCTPSFFGVDPATSDLLGGGLLRPLGAVEDIGRELMMSLAPVAAKKALIHESAVSDIVSGNRPRVNDGDEMMHMQDLWRGNFEDSVLRDLVDDIDRRAEAGSGYVQADHTQVAITDRPKGIPGSELDDHQRGILRRLLECFYGRAPRAIAEQEEARYLDDDELDSVYFAWAGSSEAGRPHYYRVQGPEILGEWDNTQRNANHAHSVWRHPAKDFGLDLLATHHHHHKH